MKYFTCLVSLSLVLAFVGSRCGGKPTRVGLAVDVFLHPDSASPDDVILQASIQQRLLESRALGDNIIHVRVIAGKVILVGTVKESVAKEEAERIARDTEAVVNGRSIRPTGEITNRIEVDR